MARYRRVDENGREKLRIGVPVPERAELWILYLKESEICLEVAAEPADLGINPAITVLCWSCERSTRKIAMHSKTAL